MLSVFIVNIPILVYGYSSLQLMAPEGRSGTSLALPFGYAAPALRLRSVTGSSKDRDRVVELPQIKMRNFPRGFAPSDFCHYSASPWCLYMLHYLYKSTSSAGSLLYKACMGIFLINLL